MYAVVRTCLICSGSAHCSLLSFWYTVRTPPLNQRSKVHSTFYMLQSSQTKYVFSNHFTIGKSVTASLNSLTRWPSKALSSIYGEKNAEIACKKYRNQKKHWHKILKKQQSTLIPGPTY